MSENEIKYLGRVIALSDYTYQSDGISYEFCLMMDGRTINKCWRNSKLHTLIDTR
jgi:hypothetical protein